MRHVRLAAAVTTSTYSSATTNTRRHSRLAQHVETHVVLHVVATLFTLATCRRRPGHADFFCCACCWCESTPAACIATCRPLSLHQQPAATHADLVQTVLSDRCQYNWQYCCCRTCCFRCSVSFGVCVAFSQTKVDCLMLASSYRKSQ